MSGLELVLGFTLVGVLSSFVEYWGHRLMHTGRVLRAKHAEHHKIGWGQGWIWEFRDYALPSLPFAWLGFLWSFPFGVGFAMGAVAYAALAAYAHQLQHERPNALFWLKQPVHAVHHYHQEWHHYSGRQALNLASGGVVTQICAGVPR